MKTKSCCYCDRKIDTDTLDWGMTLADYQYRWWHKECFEEFEEIVLEEKEDVEWSLPWSF